MTISAKMIEYSVSEQGIKLPTLQLRYPKWIHGEAKTHRKLRVGTAAVEFLDEIGLLDDPALSRNSSSSRAIPVNRLIEDVIRDPVMPVYWGANQPGMQADEELSPLNIAQAQFEWSMAMHDAIKAAQKLVRLGAHKQIVNRIIEPYSHINTIVTATDWKNFFHLRLHPAAQPEMRMLAEAIRDEIARSTPRLLKPGEWHLPFVLDDERRTLPVETLRMLSAARNARTTYLTHEGKVPELKIDLELYERLVGGDTVHASPLEHQATPDRCMRAAVPWLHPQLHGNLTGWIQNRKLVENESIPD